MPAPTDSEIQRFNDVPSWEKWLAKNHQKSADAWLLITKKGAAVPGLAIEDALDVALCYGWIDSHRRGHDKTHFLQRYSPRRAKSPWSKINRTRAEALIKEGRMQDGGHNEITAAQADGRWDIAYESQREAEIPADVASALAANKQAAKTFEGLSKSSQYALVLPILKATTPVVRARRLAKMIATLETSAAKSS